MMRNSYLWASVEVITNVLLQFVSLIVLSRFLSPEDYGIIGTITIFISLGNMLVDSGMGAALVKKDIVKPEDYSTLFCFNLFVSFLLYALIFFLAPYLYIFYNIPDLVYYIRIYSLVIIISSVGIVQITQLIRDLRYKEIAFASCISNFIAFFVAFILAYNGFGAWSLILQQIFYITGRVLFFIFSNKHIPSLKFSLKSFREQFLFGFGILSANIIHVVYMNIISSIIPKVANVTQNGYYTQANKIQNVPVSIVTSILDKVVFPVLSKSKDDITLLSEARKMLKKTVLFSTIMISICILFSGFIVEILLGERWLNVVPYLQLLFFSGFSSVYIVVTRSLFKATGKTKVILISELLKSIIGLVLIFSFICNGVWWLIGSFVLSTYVSSIITMFLLEKYIGYKIKEQIFDLSYSLFILLIIILYCGVQMFG